MSAPTGPGMGRPRGPDFSGPTMPGANQLGGVDGAAGQPLGGPAPAPAHPGPPTPPPNRLPAVLTAVAIAVVGLVVVIASVWAGHQDVQQAAPSPAPSRTISASPRPTNQIDFTTGTGSGVLTIVSHHWATDSSGSEDETTLTLDVTVSCRSGTLRYGPDSFQAFDQHGQLFEASYDPDSTTALELAKLSAGQKVSGTVSFEIPRGDVTLLLSDDLSRTITALKVPD